MMSISTQGRRKTFSIWLRTGRWPRTDGARRLELKFNPWHDPQDGRFTFAGAGTYTGRGRTGMASRSGLGTRNQSTRKIEYAEDARLPPVRNMADVEAWKATELAKHGHEPGYPEAIEAQYQRYKARFGKLPSLNQAGTVVGRLADNASSTNEGSEGNSRNFGGAGATGIWDNGGFTGGGGSFGGGGATGSWDDRGFTGGGGSFGGGGATGSWDDRGFTGGGGSFGDGGATGSWGNGGFTGGGDSFGGGGATGNWTPTHPAKPQKPTHLGPKIHSGSGANTRGVSHDRLAQSLLNDEERFGGDDVREASAATRDSTHPVGVRANQIAGSARASAVRVELETHFSGASVQSEVYLRYSRGKRAIDPLTGTSRRLDATVHFGGKALDSVEVTSLTANKAAQIAKEMRIRQSGGTFVRDRNTRELIDFSHVPTRIARRK